MGDTQNGPKPSKRSQYGLDWLNFFIADIETGFGPFVAIYLTKEGWGQGAIGSLLTVNNVVGLVTRVPAGALVDATPFKRLIAATCIGLIAGGALLISLFPTYLTAMAGEVMHGLAGGTVQTVLVAIGLGLVGHKAFHTRVGRNHRYKSFGNAFTAAGMGALGHFFSPRAPLFAAAILCVPAMASLWMIRGGEIDDSRARASQKGKNKQPAAWTQLFRNTRLLVLAGCYFLFQFANASMLPLASERLAQGGGHNSELITSALVIVPQLITGLIAGWVARKADSWGRKRLLLIGFAALPVRAVLFALDLGSWSLVGVQVLGGFTAAVIGIMIPLVVADLTRRSGRYNVSLGATNMVGAIGAAISTTAAGFVAQFLGFLVAFATLAAVALAGLGILYLFLPETADKAQDDD